MPLIIIIGRGHSGTRAISHTLTKSGVFMGARLNESGDLVPAGEFYDACRIMGSHVENKGGCAWDFSRLHSIPIDPEFERLVRSYAKSVLESTETYRGWKLPETTLVLPWIVRMFPDATYISWVRDPRDSIIGRHLTDDLADFGVTYDRVDSVREMRAISWKYQREIVAATPKPRRWIEVRFEDFVLDQDRTLKRLEEYLELPLARIEVKREAVGRWLHDCEKHDFAVFERDLVELGYVGGE